METEEKHEETRQTMSPWLATEYGDAHVNADTIFFNNFFVSRVDWWSRPEVQKYLAAVEATGCARAPCSPSRHLSTRLPPLPRSQRTPPVVV